MSGFWNFSNKYGSRVTTLLDKSDLEIEDILDERETIPELLGSNVKLTEYLRQPEILEKLVKYVVDDDEYQRKEMAEELLSSQNSDNDEIMDNKLENGVNTSEALTSDVKEQIQNNGGNINKVKEEVSNVYGENNRDNNFDTENDDAEDDVDNEDEDDDNDDDEEEEEEEDDDDEKEETETEQHTRRAQVAAEILSVDVWSITDTFMESIPLLQDLWSVLDKPAPLPIFSATYFMKINEHLLDMKTPEMVQFILNEPNIVERFMRHIQTPPLMDFMLKVISTDKPDNSTGVIEILKDQGLIPCLVGFLAKDVPSSIQSAAGDFLKAFITISANNAENTTIGPNELSRELVSEPMVRKLVNNMLEGGTGLSNGVGIVIEIIRKNNSDYDPVPVVYVSVESHPPSPKDPIYLGTLVKVFSEAMPKFTEMLEKNVETKLQTPFGSIEPLGFERFKICELVAELIHCSNMSLLNERKGEIIVKERDNVRELLIEKHKELMKIMETESNVSIDDSDFLKEIENLKLTKPESESIGEEDQPQDEKSLKESPVVGDMLKIALFDNRIVLIILKMFFKFPWNNFLHNVVFDIVQQILNAHMDFGFNKFLAIDLFDRCEITKLIINGHNNCHIYEEETGLRLGYMGHLTLIAEEVVKFTSSEIHHTTEKSILIDEAIENKEWNNYVDTTLVDIRNKYNAVLGSDGKQMNEHDMELFQKYYGSYDDDDTEVQDDEEQPPQDSPYLDSDEEEETSNFANYLGHEMANDLPDRFGSDEDSEDENKLYLNSDDGVVDSEIGGHPYHEMSAGGLDDAPAPIDEFDDVDVVDNNNNNNSNDNDNDDDDDDDDDETELLNNDLDDYEDPNDDGMSYTKLNHPLYQADGSLRSSNENL
ncbi:Sap190 protein [Martiniozyma asiatica (nom. inval.)]|nr:Sap190 protein [Martiniozyma asiatica]